MSEPFSGLFDAIRDRLIDAAGPFGSAARVRLWVDVASDLLGPDEALESELAHQQPTALICDSGGGYPDALVGGGNEYAHECRVTIRVGVRAPDYETALRGDGSNYWGIWPVVQWIVDRLTAEAFAPAGWDGGTGIDRRPIPTNTQGLVAFAIGITFTRINQV